MTENKRTIRSFVRRQGRISSGQKNALENFWSSYGVEVGADLIDFNNLFQRTAPTILEIGFGMGEALLELAEKHPENNYLGVDVHAPGVGAVLMGINNKQLTNIRLFSCDVIEVLNKAIENQSLSGIHIFFPDPWHKKRHHKRRLINENFALLIQAKLKSEGYLHLATDWEDYAQQMMQVLSNTEGFINAAGSGKYIPRPETRPLTRFEQRGTRLGHSVWDLVFIRA